MDPRSSDQSDTFAKPPSAEGSILVRRGLFA